MSISAGIEPSEPGLRGEVEAFRSKILARHALMVPASVVRQAPKLPQACSLILETLHHSFLFFLHPLACPSLTGIEISTYSHSLYWFLYLCCGRRLLIPGLLCDACMMVA
jgi:hypothetical protein